MTQVAPKMGSVASAELGINGGRPVRMKKISTTDEISCAISMVVSTG